MAREQGFNVSQYNSTGRHGPGAGFIAQDSIPKGNTYRDIINLFDPLTCVYMSTCIYIQINNATYFSFPCPPPSQEGEPCHWAGKCCYLPHLTH
jgi:hypothetical protein